MALEPCLASALKAHGLNWGRGEGGGGVEEFGI